MVRVVTCAVALTALMAVDGIWAFTALHARPWLMAIAMCSGLAAGVLGVRVYRRRLALRWELGVSVLLDSLLVTMATMPTVVWPRELYPGQLNMPGVYFFAVAIALSALRLDRGLLIRSTVVNSALALSLLGADAVMNPRDDVVIADFLLAAAVFVSLASIALSVAVHTRRLVVAGVAHELNNSLNAVMSGLPVLRRDLGKLSNMVPEEDRDRRWEKSSTRCGALIDVIEGGAGRASSVVDDLRTFSRLDQSEDLQRTADATLTVLNPGELTVHVDLHDLPQVDCCPGDIGQALLQVLSNAVQADPTRVSVTGRILEDDIELLIRDDGAGISEEDLPRVFEPFFTTRDVGAGRGLGLSTAYSIVQRHRGRIAIESQVGAWTEVRIRLPVHQDADALRL